VKFTSFSLCNKEKMIQHVKILDKPKPNEELDGEASAPKMQRTGIDPPSGEGEANQYIPAFPQSSSPCPPAKLAKVEKENGI
jgi:hypothetical protein